jgi:hypothetical protein
MKKLSKVQLQTRVNELETAKLAVDEELRVARQRLFEASRELAATKIELKEFKDEDANREACHKRLHEKVGRMSNEFEIQKRTMAAAYNDAIRTVIGGLRGNSNQPGNDDGNGGPTEGFLDAMMGLREALGLGR